MCHLQSYGNLRSCFSLVYALVGQLFLRLAEMNTTPVAEQIKDVSSNSETRHQPINSISYTDIVLAKKSGCMATLLESQQTRAVTYFGGKIKSERT